MRKTLKNVLILGATSDMAQFLINELTYYAIDTYTVSRRAFPYNSNYLHKFYADLSDEKSINSVFKNFMNIKFDAVINFQGCAISSPVEFLELSELEKQYKISVFSLVTVLKNLRGKLTKNAKIINISSMAAFGLFPFLSPYESAKAAADIILNCYELETGIKTVSVKPGVVSTKFWQNSVKLNEENFKNFPNEYEKTGEYLKQNALNNANKGIKADKVSKLVYKIIMSKNPKSSYLIGKDAKFISFLNHFKGRNLFFLIRKVLEYRVKKCKRKSF